MQKKKEKEIVPTTENGLVEYVKGKQLFLETLKSEIDQFHVDSTAYLSSKGKSPSAAKPSSETTSATTTLSPSSPEPTYALLEKSHRRLSEMLLQGLLALDSIEVPSHFAAARLERKQGVKTVQARLDGVDRVWADVKAAGQ